MTYHPNSGIIRNMNDEFKEFLAELVKEEKMKETQFKRPTPDEEYQMLKDFWGVE